MPISFSNLGSSANPDINSSTDADTYVTSSWTPPSSGLIILFVYARATGTPNAPSITGNGISYVNKSAFEWDTVHGLFLYVADATGSTTGVTTLDFEAQTQECCIASFLLVTGADLSGGVFGAIVQAVFDDTIDTSLSVPLAAAGNAANLPISCFVHIANEVTEPRTNWTEADDLAGADPVRGLNTQWRSDAFETTSST